MCQNNDLFSLLITKDIISILIGDKQYVPYVFSNGKTVPVAMPYRSGSDLCALSRIFGLPVQYVWGGSNLSRWQYLEQLMTHCEKNNSFSRLLAYLFDKNQFINSLKGLTAEEIEQAYNFIKTEILKQINVYLSFGGNELINAGGQYVVKPISQALNVENKNITIIDKDYIRSLADRALKDIDENNFDSAITKARAIVEETCIYVIESANETSSTKGDLIKFYQHACSILGMKTGKENDVRINKLLSGLSTIISSVAELRNIAGDAHGVGSKRFFIKEHHARLVLNSAVTISEFILSVMNNKKDSKR
mgnify:CR=1 FL=1